MIRTRNRMALCITLLSVILVFIWGNSLVSAEVSQAFSDWVKSLLSLVLTGDGTSSGGSGLLRKIAHFTEFAALGMCLRWLLGMLQKNAAWGVFWGGLAACIDETIQVFVPNRGPGLKDVGLDILGVCFGTALLTLVYQIYKRQTIIQEDKT